MNGHYLPLEQLLAMVDQDHPAQTWRPLLDRGPIMLAYPEWSDRFWILCTGQDQSEALLSVDQPEGGPAIGHLGLLNAIHRVHGARPLENVSEAARHICGSHPHTREGTSNV